LVEEVGEEKGVGEVESRKWKLEEAVVSWGERVL